MSMGRMVPVEVDGVAVLVATLAEPGSQATAGRAEDAARRVVDAFDHAQEAIVVVAGKVAGSVAQMAKRGIAPDRVEVEFGISFTASGGIVVVQGSGEASLTVTMVYDRVRTAITPADAGVMAVGPASSTPQA